MIAWPPDLSISTPSPFLSQPFHINPDLVTFHFLVIETTCEFSEFRTLLAVTASLIMYADSLIK